MIPNCRYTQLGEAMRPASTIQSHTYEPHESPIYRAHLAQRHCHDEHRWWTTRKQQALRRWALTLAIGVATAMVGYVINVSTKALSGWPASRTIERSGGRGGRAGFSPPSPDSAPPSPPGPLFASCR